MLETTRPDGRVTRDRGRTLRPLELLGGPRGRHKRRDIDVVKEDMMIIGPTEAGAEGEMVRVTGSLWRPLGGRAEQGRCLHDEQNQQHQSLLLS